MTKPTGLVIATTALAILLVGSLLFSGYVANQAITHNTHIEGREAAATEREAAANARFKEGNEKYNEGEKKIALADGKNADAMDTWKAFNDSDDKKASDADWASLWDNWELANGTLAAALENQTAVNDTLANASLLYNQTKDLWAEANVTLAAVLKNQTAVNATLALLGTNASRAMHTPNESESSSGHFLVGSVVSLNQTEGDQTVPLAVRGMENTTVDLVDCRAESTGEVALIYKATNGTEYREALGTAKETVKGVMPGFSFSFTAPSKILCFASKAT